MPRLLQVLLATVPLLLTPALVYALAEGWLNLGGGEKDILLAFPWLIWSVVFALCSYVLIYRRWTVGRWLRRSALFATGLLGILWILAFFVSYFAVG
jgi:hypothetical protein